MGLTNMIGRPHYRGLNILNAVTSYLPDSLQPTGVKTPEPKHYTNKENDDYYNFNKVWAKKKIGYLSEFIKTYGISNWNHMKLKFIELEKNNNAIGQMKEVINLI